MLKRQVTPDQLMQAEVIFEMGVEDDDKVAMLLQGVDWSKFVDESHEHIEMLVINLVDARWRASTLRNESCWSPLLSSLLLSLSDCRLIVILQEIMKGQ